MPPSRTSPLNLLVLERDPERRRALADPLRAAGHKVFETAEGEVAAEALADTTLDAVIVGLRTHELDFGALRDAICPSRELSPVSLEAAERAHIARTLAHTGGNRRQAALILGVARSTLLHKIRKYGLGGGTARRR